MLLLPTLVAAVLAQSSPQAPLKAAPSAPSGCVVLVTRSEGLTPDEADGIAATIGEALRTEGVPVTLSPAEVRQRAGALIAGCSNQAPCLAGAGRTLGAGAVVSVDVAKVFGELSVELALLDVATANALADKVFAAAPESPLVRAELSEFARTARYALLTLPAFRSGAAASTPARSDAPKTVSLTPADPVKEGPPAPVAAYATTGGAVAAGATAAVFGYFLFQEWQRVLPTNGDREIDLRYSELPAYQDRQRFNGIALGVAGAACTALTSAAIYFWMNPPKATGP